MTAAGMEVTVEVATNEDPIAGRILAAGQEARPFTGWLQLLSALQEAIGTLRYQETQEVCADET
jgi:hypothetical protein